MQAAALSVPASKASAGAAHGTPALDPTKPDDTETGADAFSQALAGMMGVTAGPTVAAPATTTADVAQVTPAKAAGPTPTALFAISLPASGSVPPTADPAALAPADVAQTVQAAPASEIVLPAQAAPTPAAPSAPAPTASSDTIAALTPIPPTPLAAAPVSSPPTATAPVSDVQTPPT